MNPPPHSSVLALHHNLLAHRKLGHVITWQRRQTVGLGFILLAVWFQLGGVLQMAPRCLWLQPDAEARGVDPGAEYIRSASCIRGLSLRESR